MNAAGLAAALGVASLSLLSASSCSKRDDSLRGCDVPALFQSSCDGSACHGTGSPQGGLDLVSPGLDQRLFHISSSTACDERKLVVPGHPEESVLYLKVSKEEPFCGDSMPIDRELSGPELACLRDYIEKAGTDSDGQDCETCGGILCVNFARDPLHCGSCGSSCGDGFSCRGGECFNSCNPEEFLCGGGCVLLELDNENCGSCGRRCAPGSACQQGRCVCEDSSSESGSEGGASAIIEEPSFSSDILPIFAASCSGLACHTGSSQKAPLALEADLAYAELVDQKATDCQDRTLVVPGDPDQSYLIEKLQDGEICEGERMPVVGDPLPDAKLRSIVDWICANAPNN